MDALDPIVGMVILLGAALVGGMIAHRLRQPVILGYMVVGMALGPHALSVVGDLALVETAATIGVALLMFTLGLEISVSQLRQVGKVGLWGGITQIVATFALGLLVGVAIFGWALSQATLFGLIISLSSTTVCLKILSERGELTSVHGRIMIALLIVQDISVVLMIVVMPLLGGTMENLFLALGLAIGKAVLVTGLAIAMGLWVLPWLLGRVGGVRSRELFLLTVLVLCLGAALGTQIFGLSMVFGAFLVGLVIRESRFVHQALAEITPLRDIFATLFFVSLGMLISPKFIVEHWASVATLVAVIVLVKLLVVFGVVRLFNYSGRIALLAGAGLLQIGEFGFILAQGGIDNGLITDDFYSLILSGAIITMLLTPLSMSLASWAYPRLAPTLTGSRVAARVGSPLSATKPPEAPRRVVIAGYGRTGQNIAQGLHNSGIPYTVIDIDPERMAEARSSGRPRIYGDATNQHVLSQVDLEKARTIVVTFPDPMAVVSTVKTALEINPKLKVVARVHRTREADLLKTLGEVELINPEYEASLEFLRRILTTTDLKEADVDRTLKKLEQSEEITEFNRDVEF
ncbi:cation:proton antiporter [Chloroflexota bacterium]